ncbi:MAG: HAD-IIB family hydrolase [Chlorobiales bacterium]|nr:HAD-IIB family hydrolase [Chlorobiales bacterium]
MEQNYYDNELSQLVATYQHGLTLDVAPLKSAIAGACESSIIGVGSGGSYTVASLLCNLHETYTGRLSRPVTPLEIICNPTLAAASPVFFLSAEGRNPDISEALRRARRHSARIIHVLSNRSNSLLMECVDELTDVSKHVFHLEKKDGYLATNSLLLDAIVIARAYAELDFNSNGLPPELHQLRIDRYSVEEWLDNAKKFIAELSKRRALTVVYSPLLRPIAADLESKLSEAALLHCQLADIRSYAHGRHLWLAERSGECAMLALTEPTLGSLWARMAEFIPQEIPMLSMALSGSSPQDLIAGIVAQMHLVAEIARAFDVDPGRPKVPQFGRDLYYLDLKNVIPAPFEPPAGSELSKSEVLGAHWPSSQGTSSIRREQQAFIDALTKQHFRAVVFDYDGTLCSSQRKAVPPPEKILKYIENLVRSGVEIGIASGRGGSIQEHLKEVLPDDILEHIQLGLYNGGWIGNAVLPPEKKNETSEFLNHVKRIAVRLRNLGAPIQEVKATQPYQISIRFQEGLSTEQMWFVMADSLRQAGLDLSSMVRSKHSIDVLAKGISKATLMAHIIQKFKINPNAILTMGDQGAWPGNDTALLEHRYSLSVDVPSRRLDRGWKLAPAHLRDVDATLWYLEQFTIDPAKKIFQISIAH